MPPHLKPFFFNGGFIIGNDYVRMYVTLVDLSWVVVASVVLACYYYFYAMSK